MPVTGLPQLLSRCASALESYLGCFQCNASVIAAFLSTSARPAALQVNRFQEEHDTVVRSALTLNGGAASVLTHTLVAFTGDRFLRSATSDCTTGLVVPEEETEAAQAVLAMMKSRAPGSLDVAKLQQVLQMCRFFMADALVQGFAAYLQGVASQVPAAEVRSRSAHLPRV